MSAFCRFNIYLLTVDRYFNTCLEKKKVFINVKINNCPCSCRRAQKDFGTIDLQMTYDADVITAIRKADVRLVQENRKTEVRF